MGHPTVIRYAHAAAPKGLLWGQWTNKPSAVDDVKPYLDQRWEGEHNATRLLKQITAHGYPTIGGFYQPPVLSVRLQPPVSPVRPQPSRRRSLWEFRSRPHDAWGLLQPDNRLPKE